MVRVINIISDRVFRSVSGLVDAGGNSGASAKFTTNLPKTTRIRHSQEPKRMGLELLFGNFDYVSVIHCSLPRCENELINPRQGRTRCDEHYKGYSPCVGALRPPVGHRHILLDRSWRWLAYEWVSVTQIRSSRQYQCSSCYRWLKISGAGNLRNHKSNGKTP
tara:strand:- start:226 stop:714 length:489 start_codon:yes stop_codon:yes gene_type:complete